MMTSLSVARQIALLEFGIMMVNKACRQMYSCCRLYILHTYLVYNRIRIPYNCVELIFGMVHPSTFERLKTQLFFFDSWSNVSILGVFLSD